MHFSSTTQFAPDDGDGDGEREERNVKVSRAGCQVSWKRDVQNQIETLTGQHARRATKLDGLWLRITPGTPNSTALNYKLSCTFVYRTLEAEPREGLVVFPVVDRVGSPDREGVEVLVVADLQSLNTFRKKMAQEDGRMN